MNLKLVVAGSLVAVVGLASCGLPEPSPSQDSPSEGSSYSSVPATETPRVSLDEVRKRMIQDSIFAYPGNCPCPYSRDSRGGLCGGRSAHSRPGGRSPLCFPIDISNAEAEAYRSRMIP